MARAETSAPASHRFHVYAREEGRSHAHLVPGATTHQDAALGFAEHWGGSDAQVQVIAVDAATGEERCFHIDLGAGEATPCV